MFQKCFKNVYIAYIHGHKLFGLRASVWSREWHSVNLDPPELMKNESAMHVTRFLDFIRDNATNEMRMS